MKQTPVLWASRATRPLRSYRSAGEESEIAKQGVRPRMLVASRDGRSSVPIFYTSSKLFLLKLMIVMVE
jgi:hypothetical protein